MPDIISVPLSVCGDQEPIRAGYCCQWRICLPRIGWIYEFIQWSDPEHKARLPNSEGGDGRWLRFARPGRKWLRDYPINLKHLEFLCFSPRVNLPQLRQVSIKPNLNHVHVLESEESGERDIIAPNSGNMGPRGWRREEKARLKIDRRDSDTNQCKTVLAVIRHWRVIRCAKTKSNALQWSRPRVCGNLLDQC